MGPIRSAHHHMVRKTLHWLYPSFYTNLGDIVKINVNDDNLNGQYRVTSKTISFVKQNAQCTLQLNKKPIIVSDYILAA